MIYVKGTQSLPYLMELPDGRLNLVIELESDAVNTLFAEKNLGGRHTMKRGWISGANPKAIVYESNNESTILSIRFAIGGFYALTKIPMSEIIHPGLEIELLLGSSFNKLYQKLINETDIDCIFQHIEEYFRHYIPEDNFETSITAFVDNNLDQPIDWLVRKSGYSQKHLIHTLKKQTGFSPKYLQRLRRFHQVLDHIQQYDNEIRWTEITYQYGYYDQAHFIKEFIHFTGLSPVAYSEVHAASKHNKLFKDIKLL